MADIAAVTSIEITARDLTRGALDSVRGGFNDLRGAAGSLMGVLGALGATVSIAAFASAIKGAIDYADQLNDLSKRTGIAVETLGGLGYAAEQSGTSLEAVAKGTGKLATLMADAAAGGEKAAAVFDSMGLSVRGIDGNLKSLDEMLLEVAGKFEGYQDGAEKAALANAVFGEKLGAQMIPFLDEGASKLSEMIEEYRRFGGITGDTAARADAFNDTLSKLALMAGALWRELASALLPAMQTLATILVDARDKAGGFSGVAEGVTVVVKGMAVAAIAAVEAFRAVGTSIGTVIGAIVAYLRGDSLSAIWDGVKQGFSDVGTSVSAAWENMGKVVGASTATVTAGIDKAFGPTARAPIVATAKEVEKVSKAFENLEKQLLEQVAAAANLSQVERLQIKLLGTEYANLNDAQRARLVGIAETIEAIKNEKVALEAITKGYIEAAEAIIKEQEARDASIRSAEQMVEQLDFEADALTMTNREREIAIKLRELERAGIVQGTEEWNHYAAAIRDAVERKDGLQAQIDLWREIESVAQDAFTNILQSGKGAFDRLKDALKNGLMALLYQITVKPFIVNIAAQISGNPGMVGALGAGGGGAGGLLNLFTSGSGGFNPLSFISGGASPFIEGTSAFVGPLAEGAGLMGGLLSAVGQFVPYIGAALALASAFGLFDKDPSQVQGKFGIRTGADGFEDNAFTSSKFGNIGFLDDGTKYFGGEAAQVFNQVVSKTLDAIGSRLSADQNASLAKRLQGMDFGSFEGEYTTEDFIKKYGAEILGKVISAGLEELDPKLAAVFNAFKGTADEMGEFANVLLVLHDITKNIPSDLRDTLIAALDGTVEMSGQVLALAAAYVTLQEAMNRDPLEDALDAIARAGRSAYETLDAMADGFEDLIIAFDGSEEASKGIAQATVDYYNALVNVIAGIEQLRTSIASMFDATIEDMTLQTLDDGGKKKFYQDRISQLYGDLGAASDPADIERITKQINEYMRAAFGLLTPEEQQGLLSQYVEFARQVQDLADQRLAEAEAAAQARADQLFTQLRDALAGAAASMMQAGATMKSAAGDMKDAASQSLAAARQPIVVEIPDPVVDR